MKISYNTGFSKTDGFRPLYQVGEEMSTNQGTGEKEHVIATKEALVRQHPSLPFHAMRGGGGGPRRGSEGVGSDV